MTALNFPAQPQDIGNTYVGGNGVTYVWSGTIWSVAGNPGSTGNVVFAGNTIATASGGNVIIQAGSADWVFQTNSALLAPSPTSSLMTLSLGSDNFVPRQGKSQLILTSDPWFFQGEFVYTQDGQASLMLNNPFPELVNPGYDSLDSFVFDSAVTGFVDYVLTLELTDVTYPGPAGWTANVNASEPPEYPSTLQSLGAIKLTSSAASWTLSTGGQLYLPANMSGIPTEISLNGGPAVGYTTATNVPTYSDSGSGSGLTVDIVANGSSISSVAINQPGQGYAPGDQLAIDQQGSTGNGEITVVSVRATTSSIEWPGLANLSASDVGVTIQTLADSTNSNWLFDLNGVLNLPNNNGQIGQLELPYTGLEFRAGSGSDWIGISYGEIDDNNTSYFYFDKDGPDYVTANHLAHLQIKNSAHDGHVEWLFDNSGNLTLPSGGTINFADGSNALVGSGGGVTNQLVNSIYNVTLNDNGTLSVVDYIQSLSTSAIDIISDSSANLRWVSNLNDPGSDPATWILVNSDGVNFQSYRSAGFVGNYNQWQFDNLGVTNLPLGGLIASANDTTYLTSNVVAVARTLQTNTGFLQGRTINGAGTFAVNAVGTQGWISQYGASTGNVTAEYGAAVATDAHDGAVYAFGGQSNLNAIENMVKYDSQGTVIWQTALASSASNLASTVATSMVIDSDNRSLFAATWLEYDGHSTLSVSNVSATDGSLTWETEITLNTSTFLYPYPYELAYSRLSGAAGGNIWLAGNGQGVNSYAPTVIKLDSVSGAVTAANYYLTSYFPDAGNGWFYSIDTEYAPGSAITHNNAYVAGSTYTTDVSGRYNGIVGKILEDGTGDWATSLLYSSSSTSGLGVAYDQGNVFATGVIYGNNTYAWSSSMDAMTGAVNWTTRWQSIDGAEGVTTVAGAGNLYVAGLCFDQGYKIGTFVSQIDQNTGEIMWINQLSSQGLGLEFMNYVGSSAHAMDWDSSDPQSPLVLTWLNVTGGMAGSDTNMITMRVPSDGSLEGSYGSWVYSNILAQTTTYSNDIAAQTGGSFTRNSYSYSATSGNLSVSTAGEQTWLNAMGPTAAWQFGSDGVLALPDGGYIDDNGGITRLGAAGAAGAQIGSSDTQNYVTASDAGVTIQTLADSTNSNWLFDTSGYLTMPLHTRLNSGGVGNTNSAEFGTVVNTYGDNGVVQNSQIYMSAGTGEARILVNMEGHTLVYYGTEEVYNPNFTGMVAMDPSVRSQYAIASENGNIILGGAQPGGTLVSSDYIAGIGSLNNNYNMNGLYVDTTAVLISTGSEGAVNNSQQFGTNGISTTTTFGNISTNTSQAASYWLALAQDSTTGLYPAQAKIDVCLANIDTPEVYIDLKRASDGFNVLWTFDNTGNLTLPTGGTINWADGSNALVGGGSVAFNPTTLVQSVSITAAGNQGGGGEYAVTYTTSSLATVIATGIVTVCQGTTQYTSGSAAVGSQTVTGNFDNSYADRPYTVYAHITTDVGTIWSAQASGTTGMCLIAGTRITLSDGSTKAIEHISYDDHIRVWDFDTASFAQARALWIKRVETATAYNELMFSDGSSLRTVDQHRIFNKQAGAFTYPMTDDTPIGTITHTVDGAEVVLVGKRVVTATVDYYNVITDRHMNLFANSILTSCRFSNAYPITDMRWVKNHRPLRDRAEFVGIADRWIDGLRLCEQTYSVDDIRWYVRRLESLEITELAQAA